MGSIPRVVSQVLLIRAPEGKVIAHVRREGEALVLVRRVREKHRFRVRDAWSLGEHALRQVQEIPVARLRYIADDGKYEVDLPTFLREGELLPFAHEAQHVLPRARWGFTPRRPVAEQTSLFFELGGALP